MSIGLCTIIQDEFYQHRKSAMTALGAYILEQLRVQGWDQADLSSMSGVSEPTISRMINQSKRPQSHNVVKIAKAFGDEPRKLLILAGYPVGEAKSADEEAQALIAQIESFPWLRDLLPQMLQLNPQNQAAVRAVIQALGGLQNDSE